MRTACGLESRRSVWDSVLPLDGFEVVHQAGDVAEKTLRLTVIRLCTNNQIEHFM